MEKKEIKREIIRFLMLCPCYFKLTLKERLDLVNFTFEEFKKCKK